MLEDLVLLSPHEDQGSAQIAAVAAVVGCAEHGQGLASVMPFVAVAAVRHLVAPHDQAQVVRLQKAPRHICTEGDDRVAASVAPDPFTLVGVRPHAVEQEDVRPHTRTLGQRPPEGQAPELRQAEVPAPEAAVDDEDLIINERGQRQILKKRVEGVEEVVALLDPPLVHTFVSEAVGLVHDRVLVVAPVHVDAVGIPDLEE
mmetsp:Transcript_10013/g.24988  ORF Transcript_10013/g.24988 Transcript_10013/m.24988 type:complete len:201 (+) Transcript_10013:1486-2088(+)